MQQSVSLLRVKDPLFKRMGASRLTRFAIDGIFLILFVVISAYAFILIIFYRLELREFIHIV